MKIIHSIIIILYNVRSYWFKQCALSEYRARSKGKLMPSSAEMKDEFPTFSLEFIERLKKYFLFNLYNENENELLAAVYLEAVKVTDKIYEKADKSTEVNRDL